MIWKIFQSVNSRSAGTISTYECLVNTHIFYGLSKTISICNWTLFDQHTESEPYKSQWNWGHGFYSERPRGAGFRSVNPAERWRENPERALARAGFSQQLECRIHRSESSPEGSFALIPHPVVLPICASTDDVLSTMRAEKRCLQTGRVCDDVEIPQSRMATATSRLPARDIRDTVNPPRGFDQSAMLTSYRMWDYIVDSTVSLFVPLFLNLIDLALLSQPNKFGCFVLC